MTLKTRCSLYLISPPSITLDEFAAQLEEAFTGGEVAAFQLRLKDVDDAQVVAAAKRLLPICHRYNAQMIINDRADIAKLVGADGVHIGDDDDSYKRARDILGGEKVIGVSCYDSTDKAMTAGNEGADYVSFGAFFPTTTKVPKAHPAPDILQWWSTYSTVPCVAIGGINAKNCAELVRNGADFVAVVSAVWGHPNGPKAAVQELLRAITKNVEQF